jgi:hypothetical protein
MPTPPTTTKAPVVVFNEVVLAVNLTGCCAA